MILSYGVGPGDLDFSGEGSAVGGLLMFLLVGFTWLGAIRILRWIGLEETSAAVMSFALIFWVFPFVYFFLIL